MLFRRGRLSVSSKQGDVTLFREPFRSWGGFGRKGLARLPGSRDPSALRCDRGLRAQRCWVAKGPQIHGRGCRIVTADTEVCRRAVLVLARVLGLPFIGGDRPSRSASELAILRKPRRRKAATSLPKRPPCTVREIKWVCHERLPLNSELPTMRPGPRVSIRPIAFATTKDACPVPTNQDLAGRTSCGLTFRYTGPIPTASVASVQSSDWGVPNDKAVRVRSGAARSNAHSSRRPGARRLAGLKP